MEADVAVTQGVIFEAEALEVNSLAGDYILVIGFRVGQLGFVEVVTCLGEHNPFLSDIDADAIDGGDVLTEELFLLERSSIDDVEIHLHAFELQLVAQSNVVDEFAKGKPNNYKLQIRQIIVDLAKEGKLIKLSNDYYIHKSHYDKILELIYKYFETHEQMKMAELRDMLGNSRKFALLILEYTDAKRITKRVGDYRVKF